MRPATIDDLDAFFGIEDRDAPVADFSDLLQAPHRFLNLLGAQLIDRRIVDLIEIDVVGAQAPQRSVDGLKDVLLRDVFRERAGRCAHDSDFRGDDRVLPFAREHDAEQRLAAAEAVRVGGVEERHAEIARAPDRGERFVIARLSPAERRA